MKKIESKIGQELEGLMNEYQSLENKLMKYVGKDKLSKQSLGKIEKTKKEFYEVVGKLYELSGGKIKVKIPEDKIKELENKFRSFDKPRHFGFAIYY